MATDINTAAVVTSLAEADYVFASLAAGTGPRRVLRSAMGTPAAAVLVVSAGATNPAVRGRLDRPYATPALAKAAEQSGDTIIVYPGAYTVTTDLSNSVALWFLLPGASMAASGGGVLPRYTSTIDLNLIRVGVVSAGKAPTLVNVGQIIGKQGSTPNSSGGGLAPAPGDLVVQAAENVAGVKSGSVLITGGDADTAAGGDVVIHAGLNDNGNLGGYTAGTIFVGSADELGRIVVGQLPIVDPLRAGQLWNSSGTLKVSAG